MAEKNKVTKDKKDKDKNKILAVIGVLIIAGAVLFFLVNSKSYDSGGDAGVEVPVEEASLTSREWTWTNTQYNDDSTVEPSTAGAFTANFQEDGTLSVTTDCNNGTGSYEEGEGNTLIIGPMAATRKFCESSNEQDYFAQINEVESYLIQDGKLILQLPLDSGSMIFE